MFKRPEEVPSGSGYVNSAANSKPTGKYPVMNNPNRKAVPNTIQMFILIVKVNSSIDASDNTYITKVVSLKITKIIPKVE